MFNLNDLQLFVHIVDHGGFTAASRALKLPKQTLSKRLAELERRAGVRLIQRTSRSFLVTELGRELYRHAAAMVIEAEAAENVILGRLSEPSGTVRITAAVPTVQVRLASLLPEIARTYPRIRCVLDASDRFVDVVRDGYDIALRSHVAPLPDSDLVQRRIGTEEIWLVASREYCAGRTLAKPEDIRHFDGIFASERETTLVLRDDGGDEHRVELTPRYIANEASAIRGAVDAGLGIGALPSAMCARDIRDGTLVRVCSGYTAGEITMTLLMPHRRGLLPSVRVVADVITKQFAL